MTKTIVIGEHKDNAIKKTIEFFSQLNVLKSDSIEIENVATSNPHHWNYIELICKNYAPNLDLMFAYDDADDREEGILIIGRWNDGTVK